MDRFFFEHCGIHNKKNLIITKDSLNFLDLNNQLGINDIFVIKTNLLFISTLKHRKPQRFCSKILFSVTRIKMHKKFTLNNFRMTLFSSRHDKNMKKI